MSLLLTPEELFELTGLQQHAAQRRWLESNGWRYEIDVRGRPKVARAYFERKMSEEAALETTADGEPAHWAVNVGALRRT